MSDIVWCDIGGHPFSAAEPGRKFWTEVGNEYGQDQSRARIDACGEHANFRVRMPNFVNPSQAQLSAGFKSKAAKDAAEKGFDPGYVKWLEDQADKPIEDLEPNV